MSARPARVASSLSSSPRRRSFPSAKAALRRVSKPVLRERTMSMSVLTTDGSPVQARAVTACDRATSPSIFRPNLPRRAMLTSSGVTMLSRDTPHANAMCAPST
jgi:hypothetical protein